jgi:hypothetical protein
VVEYCHTHIATGRRYIGLTKMTIEKRWYAHLYSSKLVRNGKPRYKSHFANAIRKYGKDAFSHETLQENISTIEEANQAEDRWIEHFNTRDLKFGFNLMPGGIYKSGSIFDNPWLRPEYRAKGMEAAKRRAATPAARAIFVANGRMSKGRSLVRKLATELALPPKEGPAKFLDQKLGPNYRMLQNRGVQNSRRLLV